MKRLAFVLPNLLTWDGQRPVIGGLERFAWALLEVARSLGFAVEVHQNGSADWERELAGVRIRGHGLARLSALAAWESIHHQVAALDGVVYLAIMQAIMPYRPGSLIVAHGVWWDTPGADVQGQLRACQHALDQAAAMVAVDYNFLNVMRAVLPALAGKIRVIPNFADTTRFRPPAHAPSGPPVVLFPRRLDPARGVDLFLDAVGMVASRFPEARFRLAVDDNRAFPAMMEHLKARLAEEPMKDRVEMTTATFDHMPAVYAAAEVVVIPSTHSEGTAFGCLEAMASGRAVVATEVGGLTNLIIPGFNGLLVPPVPDRVAEAICTLIEDAGLRRRLGRHARQTALALGRERWEKGWAEALLSVYGHP